MVYKERSGIGVRLEIELKKAFEEELREKVKGLIQNLTEEVLKLENRAKTISERFDAISFELNEWERKNHKKLENDKPEETPPLKGKKRLFVELTGEVAEDFEKIISSGKYATKADFIRSKIKEEQL
jgi:hypothetical protein